MIPKSGNRFSEKIMRHKKRALRSGTGFGTNARQTTLQSRTSMQLSAASRVEV
jgi:hypothetical protein